MNADIKAKWVAALRSGEYKQGHEHLRVDDSYCCLGVLCDLYAITHGVPFGDNLRAGGGNDELPAEEVCEWAGLKDNDPEVFIDGIPRCVSVHNDGTAVPLKTFAQIAAAIEEQL